MDAGRRRLARILLNWPATIEITLRHQLGALQGPIICYRHHFGFPDISTPQDSPQKHFKFLPPFAASRRLRFRPRLKGEIASRPLRS